MKLSYLITVCNEWQVFDLIDKINQYKDDEDNVIVLWDTENGDRKLYDKLNLTYNKLSKFNLIEYGLHNDFAAFKNYGGTFCNGDYIFQLDADELIDKFLIENIKSIIQENENPDLIYLPRINIVDDITDEYIKQMGWFATDSNFGLVINYPDWQGRIYKRDNSIQWKGKVHERINGINTCVILTIGTEIKDNFRFSIMHRKTFERQQKQNEFYETL